MSADGCGLDCINCYALVAYLPDPLAAFLDELRLRLIPGCKPHAHVTLLPPRPLADPEEALRQLRRRMADVPAFEVQASGLAVFPRTDVIYVDIGEGRDTLIDLHTRLNSDALWFDEPFPYHPHITLAQEIQPGRLEELEAIARKAWSEYPYPRMFPVEDLVFVQNTVQNNWLDLASVRLREQSRYLEGALV